MKLISWNVNGLRACMTKGFADFMTASDADIFCVQETKMQREQATFDFPNYFEYWNSAEKKGYSGTAVFTKEEPLNVTYGLGIDEHDHEGRVITCEFPEFNLVNVYTPNSQDGLTRLAYRQVWEDAFRNYLLELDAKKPVLVCGDVYKRQTLVIATSNLGKLDEFKEMFKELPVELKCLADYPPLPPPNENGRTFAANAKTKATYYAKHLNEFCLADDSGLEVKALGGEPGVRSARFAGEEATDKENNDLLLQQMKFQITRTCRFRCALAVANPTGRIVAETDGSCEGMLLHEPLGENGFGYDPLFWSTELHKGLGEATAEEKNKISHRGKAVRKLIAMWKKAANNKNGKRQEKQGRKYSNEQQVNGKAEQENGASKPEREARPDTKPEVKTESKPEPETN